MLISQWRPTEVAAPTPVPDNDPDRERDAAATISWWATEAARGRRVAER